MNRTYSVFFSIVFGLLLLSGYALADSATITRMEGEVFLLTNPGKSEPAPGGTLVSYEHQMYTQRSAKPGDRMEDGNVIRCAPDSKVRLIYENGDVAEVFSGTSYLIRTAQKAGVPQTSVQLHFGQVRFVISSQGPRKHLSVRSQSAVMGVRGTDFIVREEGSKGSRVTVLRGKVAVTVTGTVQKEFTVGAGSTGVILAKPQGGFQESAPRATTRSELREIQAMSKMSRSDSAELAALEARALESALKDAGISGTEVGSLEALDDLLIRKKFEVYKLNSDEAEGTDGDAYRKFFKNAQ